MSVNSPVAPRRQLSNAGGWPRRLLVWSPIAAGLIVLYLPSMVDLFRGIWSTDQQAHGPIVLGIACWLIYRKWRGMLRASEGGTWFRHWLAHLSHRITALYHWSLAGYSNLRDRLDYLAALGDSFAHVWHGRAEGAMVLTVLYALHDPSAGAIVDALTMPMKMAVSYVAENILFWADYPIARTGVILQIGQI